MSSTNRGGVREVSDYYVTPVEEIVNMLNALFIEYPKAREAFSGMVLDPAAGGDASHNMSYPWAMFNAGLPLRTLNTLDIREDSLAQLRGRDYLAFDPSCTYSVIMTNPPFALAQKFIEKAYMEVEPEGGLVIMLLRLNFFGSAKRLSMWRVSPGMPTFTFVHSKRMSFTDDGKTDSIEYMHCVWVRSLGDYPLGSTRLFLL